MVASPHEYRGGSPSRRGRTPGCASTKTPPLLGAPLDPTEVVLRAVRDTDGGAEEGKSGGLQGVPPGGLRLVPGDV